MNFKTNSKSVLILLELLKAHGIRKVVASPGTTNIQLVASMQYDSYFEMYSSVDERSAAYMACGLAAESGEPVIITCTGATASRNYMPGLTEAYYRKLPILAITGSHGEEKIGHLFSQVIDRTKVPNDILKISVNVSKWDSPKVDWQNMININKALLELTRHGGGPVHINLETGSPFVRDTPKVQIIKRYFVNSIKFPEIPIGRVGIFIGSHKKFSPLETELIDSFCACHNGVVFCDHTSSYHGKFKVLYALVACQRNYDSDVMSPDLLIHIGEVSGENYFAKKIKAKQTWRVNEDGEIRDCFGTLSNIFEMDEISFFKKYTQSKQELYTEYFDCANTEYESILKNLPPLPFSNLWIASKIHDKLPTDCILHLGIFNSLRSWNFFKIGSTIDSFCNVGGFGIDGVVSTLIGSSLATPEKIHFCVVGDLAFFYDLNSIGNHHVASNIRILLINNGRGTEFRNFDHYGARFGSDADKYIAAAGHFGSQSPTLVKHYAEDLGFKYLSAFSKEDFYNVYKDFISPLKQDKPIIFEVFTTPENESEAILTVRSIIKENFSLVKVVTEKIKSVLKPIKK